jgi:carbamoyl-phosphate synthase large subunit
LASVDVLLTCAGQRVDIVRAFQATLAEGPHDGRVLVSDLDPLSPSLFAADGVIDLPRVDEPGYGDAVAQACRSEGIRAVLPLTDLDPVVLAEATEAIEAAGAALFLPGPEVALGCQDKWACHELLGASGLPSPPTWLPDALDPAALPYPVLVKPRLGFAGRHIHRAADREELAFFLRYTPAPSVVQQALPGEEFSIDCLGGLDGRALGAIPRSMIQSKGGEQIKGETLDDPHLVELGARTVETLGLRGPSTVQCFRADGRILGITDINTRFGGAFPLPLAAGGAYPELIVRMAAGESPPSRVGLHRAGVLITRFLDQHLLERGPEGLVPLEGSAEATAASGRS